MDPASSLSLEHDKGMKVLKPSVRYFVNYLNCGAKFSLVLRHGDESGCLKVC